MSNLLSTCKLSSNRTMHLAFSSIVHKTMFFPYLCHCLSLSVLLIIIILLGMKCYITVAL
jgi:hypothetical protein